MKKIIAMIFIILAIVLINATVNADMGAPMIKPYEAYVSNVEGANYYEHNEKNITQIGKLNYGEEIKIKYEWDFNGEIYGIFDYENQREYYIKVSDIEVVDSNEVITEHDDELQKLCILANEGVEMYNGPAYGYSKKGIVIPKYTQINGYRCEEQDKGQCPWYYVTYNGENGWICELNGTVGSKSEYKLMTPNPVQIEDKVYNGNVLGTIPANIIVSDYYDVDAWSFSYYVKYNGVEGYISRYAVATTWEKEGEWKTIYEANIYEKADESSKIVYKNVPIGTTVKYSYSTDIRGEGWAYVTYKNSSGWIHVIEDEGTYMNLKSEIEEKSAASNEVKNIDEVTLNKPEEKNEIVSNIETNNDKIQNQPVNTSVKTTLGIERILLYVFGAIIIGLTTLVIILVVNTKKSDK